MCIFVDMIVEIYYFLKSLLMDNQEYHSGYRSIIYTIGNTKAIG